jgi:sulfur-oxidizing protein SoxY
MSKYNIGRRTLVKGILGAGILALAAGFGLFRPARLLAAGWPSDAFGAETEAKAVRALFGDAIAVPVDAVRLEAPKQAMYGQAVPVKVRADMNGVELIAILTEHNPHPLNTYLRVLGPVGLYGTRIRVERTSPVTAYIRAGGQLYKASVTVKVTRGGYGVNVL